MLHLLLGVIVMTLPFSCLSSQCKQPILFRKSEHHPVTGEQICRCPHCGVMHAMVKKWSPWASAPEFEPMAVIDDHGRIVKVRIHYHGQADC